jgi:hypothetical protein
LRDQPCFFPDIFFPLWSTLTRNPPGFRIGVFPFNLKFTALSESCKNYSFTFLWRNSFKKPYAPPITPCKGIPPSPAVSFPPGNSAPAITKKTLFPESSDETLIASLGKFFRQYFYIKVLPHLYPNC